MTHTAPTPVLAGEFNHDSVGPVGRFRYDSAYLAASVVLHSV